MINEIQIWNIFYFLWFILCMFDHTVLLQYGAKTLNNLEDP